MTVTTMMTVGGCTVERGGGEPSFSRHSLVIRARASVDSSGPSVRCRRALGETRAAFECVRSRRRRATTTASSLEFRMMVLPPKYVVCRGVFVDAASSDA